MSGLNNKELLEEASEAALQAIAFDNGNSISAAIYFYKHAASLLLEAIQKGFCRSTLDDKIKQYTERAEELEQKKGLLAMNFKIPI